MLGTAATRLLGGRMVGQLLGGGTGTLAEDAVALLRGRPEHQLPTATTNHNIKYCIYLRIYIYQYDSVTGTTVRMCKIDNVYTVQYSTLYKKATISVSPFRFFVVVKRSAFMPIH